MIFALAIISLSFTEINFVSVLFYTKSNFDFGLFYTKFNLDCRLRDLRNLGGAEKWQGLRKFFGLAIRRATVKG